MSTYARDLASQFNNGSGGPSVSPVSISGTTSGSGVDLLLGDGLCNACLEVGVITAGTNPTITMTMYESDDDGSSDPYALVQPSVTVSVAAASSTWIPAFQRSKRYVRAHLVIDGGASAALVSASIWEQLKVFTGNE